MNILKKLTLKSLKLNRKRSMVTTIGIILSVALITAVAGVYVSGMTSLINFARTERGNFHVSYYDVPKDEIELFKTNRKIEEIFLIKHIGYAKLEGIKNENKPYAQVKGYTKDSLKNLCCILTDGRLPENENEIVIPTHLKTNGRLVLSLGDEITLDIGKRVTSDGLEINKDNPYTENEKVIDTTSKTYKIVGIIERPASTIESYSSPGYSFITYIDEKDVAGKVDVYTRYTKEGLDNFNRVTANILGIDENLFEKVNSENPNYTKEDMQEFEKQMQNAKYKVDANTYVIMLEKDPAKIINDTGGIEILAGVVCIIIVITSVFCIKNSFAISITEKTKLYGMLRSVGATKKQIRKNVLFEAFILGIIGIPIGILSGFLATFILMKVSNMFLEDILTQRNVP